MDHRDSIWEHHTYFSIARLITDNTNTCLYHKSGILISSAAGSKSKPLSAIIEQASASEANYV
jgi:hypothetical protein